MDITEALCHFLNLTFCQPTKNIFIEEIVAYVVEGEGAKVCCGAL